MTSLDPRPFYRAGALGAALQLLALVVLVAVGIALGPRPETAAEAFAAWSGLLGNGFDLVQHAIHPFMPAVASAIAIGMGLLYLVWFPMLAWDFARLARVEHAPSGPRGAGTPSPGTPRAATGSARHR